MLFPRLVSGDHQTHRESFAIAEIDAVMFLRRWCGGRVNVTVRPSNQCFFGQPKNCTDFARIAGSIGSISFVKIPLCSLSEQSKIQ